MISVRVEGVEEVLKTLKGLDSSLAENGLRQGVNAVAREIVKESRVNLAPHKRTGNLARSLGTSTRINRRTKSVDGKARTRRTKTADGFYGRFLEFGTKYITPIAWMRRAAITVTPKSNDIIARTVKKNMPKIIARAKKRGII